MLTSYSLLKRHSTVVLGAILTLITCTIFADEPQSSWTDPNVLIDKPGATPMYGQTPDVVMNYDQTSSLVYVTDQKIVYKKLYWNGALTKDSKGVPISFDLYKGDLAHIPFKPSIASAGELSTFVGWTSTAPNQFEKDVFYCRVYTVNTPCAPIYLGRGAVTGIKLAADELGWLYMAWVIKTNAGFQLQVAYLNAFNTHLAIQTLPLNGYSSINDISIALRHGALNKSLITIGVKFHTAPNAAPSAGTITALHDNVHTTNPANNTTFSWIGNNSLSVFTDKNVNNILVGGGQRGILNSNKYNARITAILSACNQNDTCNINLYKDGATSNSISSSVKPIHAAISNSSDTFIAVDTYESNQDRIKILTFDNNVNPTDIKEIKSYVTPNVDNIAIDGREGSIAVAWEEGQDEKSVIRFVSRYIKRSCGLSTKGQMIFDLLLLNDQNKEHLRGTDWELTCNNKITLPQGENDNDVLVTPKTAFSKGVYTHPTDSQCNDSSVCDEIGLVKCTDSSQCKGTEQCIPLRAAVKDPLLTQIPKFCAGEDHVVLNKIWDMYAHTNTYIDYTGLRPPESRFLTAMKNGLIYRTSPKNLNPSGVITTKFLTASATKQGDPTWDQEWGNFLKGIQSNPKLNIVIGHFGAEREVLSGAWNHSKTIIRDGEEAIVGSHVWWNVDLPISQGSHLGEQSVVVHGGAVMDAVHFTNVLWDMACRSTSVIVPAVYSSDMCLALKRHEVILNSQPGNTRIISVGTPGSRAERKWYAGDEGILQMINASRRSIHIMQQGLTLSVGETDPRILDALGQAMIRGVKVNIILPDPETIDEGTGSTLGEEPKAQIPIYKAAMLDYISAKTGKSISDSESFLASMLSMDTAPAKIGGRIPYYPHEKMVIVDSQLIYIGSQNLASGSFMVTMDVLGVHIGNFHNAEFGYIIDNPAIATWTLKERWQKLWDYMQVHKSAPVIIDDASDLTNNDSDVDIDDNLTAE